MLIRKGEQSLNVKRVQNYLRSVGFNPGPIDGIFGPKTEAAVMDFQKRNGLEIDGIVGPKTLAAMPEIELYKDAKPVQLPPSASPEESDQAMAKAFGFAKAEIGQKEISGSKDNPRILEYHAVTTLKATDDEVPWCASFVCWCLEKAGIKSTKSAAASSYKTWGVEGEGRVGDIAVFKRTGGHHVAFIAEPYKKGDKMIKVLGGNQSNAVNIKEFTASNLLAVRKIS